jgi:hypothetical protein
MVAHAAFRLVDDFTSQAPIGPMRFLLDHERAPNTWEPTTEKPIVTASGVILYAFVEKRGDVIGAAPRKYRFRVESDFYHPGYQASSDGIVFDAFPYNDEAVVHPYAAVVQIVPLHPSPLYAFPSEVPVLRGTVVRQSNGERVAFARVVKAAEETALSDSRGEFALPLRWIQNPQFDIDVIDLRTNESRTKTIVVPDMLGMNVVIDIL